MKKNMLLFAAIALVGTGILTLNSLQAQDASAPGAPPVGQAPPPGSRPAGPPPGFRPRMMANSYQRTVAYLKRCKMDLQRSTDDYGGHRQSAIDACDKAVQELEAVQSSIQASAKAAAEAAAAARATNQPPQQAPTPAPNQ